MIVFEKVRWRNFLSTGNAFTEIDIGKSPTTLIVGSNGSGKSTLIDALTFALFNKPFRKIKVAQLINSINQKDGLVEVEFSIGASKYKIRRGIKPNIFEIYQNNILVNQDAHSKDYQQFLEKQILKLNYKSFTQIVVLGSSSFIPFMQLPAPHRREVIEDLLDIQIFTRMNDILKVEMTTLAQNFKDTEKDLDVVIQKRDLQEQYIGRLDEQRKKSAHEINDKISKSKKNIDGYQRDITDLQEQIDTLQKGIIDEEVVSKRLKKITSLQDALEKNKGRIAKDITFYLENDECNTCKQSIDPAFKTKILDARQDKAKEIELASIELDNKFNDVNNRINEIVDTQNKITQIQYNINSLNANIQAENRSIDSYNIDITKINEVENSEDEMLKLQDYRQEETKLRDEKTKLNDERYYAEISGNLLKDTGIKTKIINQYLPVINHYVNHYLQSLDFFVQFNLDNSFKETIKSRHRDEFSYASFSEGEKLRIDLSLLFTWRTIAKMKNSTNTNLLILDEVFDSSLDNNGTDEFLKILNTMAKGINAFVISHKGDILIDKFSNTLKFEKANNYSRLV
jgi:DNA repair exonuclease SbcCD ATPase subunit|tara:strand:- start:3 stop:1712 length:1710 start_codon:yes stop_codon:yes gene_type:complete